MKIIYRISDSGYNKVKPNYINNENQYRYTMWFIKLNDVITEELLHQGNDNSSEFYHSIYLSKLDLL